MTPAEFKKKWGRYRGKESSGYQEHFNDLCRLLGQPTPAEADPTGEAQFCFQKRVVKDAELFVVREAGAEYGDEAKRGFADVWKKDCFAWEYKGRKKNLDEAFKQLLRYREALLNPPLLVVCDFDRYIIRTNFNGTVQETIEFTNDQLDQPEVLRRLRWMFTQPDLLKPSQTTDRVTEQLAEKIAQVALSLNKREGIEYSNAKRRAEVNVAQKKNLRVARFLNRIIFCFFAEDVGLLPEGTFSEVAQAGLDDPHFFAERLEALFEVMATGGSFGSKKIRHFNGHLFEEATVFELTGEEIRALADASEADWQFIEPSILGTLFERALDVDQRAQLGAHYTSKADIETLVEPVLMAPLRRAWKALKKELAGDYTRGKGTPAAKKKIEAFLKQVRSTVVLDPACGSGNFLYVALQKLLGLEKDVLAYAQQLDFTGLKPGVSVQQLRAIEINPYAYELAQVAVQIGYLQWLRDNGFALDRDPVLQELEGFDHSDALMRDVFKRKPKDLKEARKDEHEKDEGAKGFVERVWPECDVIVSNPPFLHSSKFIRKLGESYRKELFDCFDGRVPGFADLCCYWFEKARALIEEKKCKRAGLLATQGIRGGASRDVLKRINDTGNIFWAVSDRDWVLAGANVHVSLIAFDDGTEKEIILDGCRVREIHPNLTASADTTTAVSLTDNVDQCFYGSQQKAPFDIDDANGLAFLIDPNPSGRPNSDVVRPSLNAAQLMRRELPTWVVDFGQERDHDKAALYAAPYAYVARVIKPMREGHREDGQAKHWWLHARPSPRYREVSAIRQRTLITPCVSKHRAFVFVTNEVLVDHAICVFARDDDYFFGVLHSRFHEVWALAQGTQLREKESGFRYTPTTCFETFPLPDESLRDFAAWRENISAAAKALNELRERWLNPPEWTKTEVLEFPGTVGGPWDRYVLKSETRNLKPGDVGTVRYPRLVPKDAECAAKLKARTLTQLYNERPTWLDLAHKKLDAAVAAAYGWPADLSEEAILEKLLQLNLARAAAQPPAVASKKSRRATADQHQGQLF